MTAPCAGAPALHRHTAITPKCSRRPIRLSGSESEFTTTWLTALAGAPRVVPGSRRLRIYTPCAVPPTATAINGAIFAESAIPSELFNDSTAYSSGRAT